MTYLVDTDTFSLNAADHPRVVPAVLRHGRADAVVLPVLAVREVWRGLVALVGKAYTPEREAAYELMTETVTGLQVSSYWRSVGGLRWRGKPFPRLEPPCSAATT